MSSKVKEFVTVDRYDPAIHDPASVDNQPIEVPLEWKEPPSLQEEIRRFIRVEMSRVAGEQGHETFEEANDLEFSDDDDFDGSANELTEDQEMAMMALARSSRDKGESDDSQSDGRGQAVERNAGGDVDGGAGKGSRVDSAVVEEVRGKESPVSGGVQGGSKGG